MYSFAILGNIIIHLPLKDYFFNPQKMLINKDNIKLKIKEIQKRNKIVNHYNSLIIYIFNK